MKRIISVMMVVMLLIGLLLPLTGIAEGGTVVTVDLAAAADEELEEAVARIRAEQRSRLKTRISFDISEVTLVKGKSAKITAEVVDVPEGLTVSKIEWSSSDSKVAACKQGTVKGVGNGKATITASCTLSDGTEIRNECGVTVFTPVTGLSSKTKKYDIGVGESIQTEVTVQPKDATNASLEYSSSDSSVAAVDANGVITGVGIGTAAITVKAADGSGKTVELSVKSSRKDDRGKAKADNNGCIFKVYGFKQTQNLTSMVSPKLIPLIGKIPDDYRYVLIDVEIDNQTTETVNMMPYLCSAECDGMQIDVAEADIFINKNLLRDAAPGKKLRGVISFVVPADWKEILFQAHVLLGSQVEFVLYNQ